MRIDKNQQAFFELLRAGLWSDQRSVQKFNVQEFKDIDWQEVYRLASEQSVLGLVLAGMEHFEVKPPQMLLLQWIGEVQMIEQRNKAMNRFIAKLVDKMRAVGIYTLLVKGQGVAQCYEKPLWRSCGDVDFYLSDSNYNAAKEYLRPLSSEEGIEDKARKHLGITIGSWVVELHGTMYSGFSRRMNRVLDEVHKSIFYEGDVRSWNNSGVTIFLPSADNDVIIVFTHFLQHFYVGGIGLRQICDWCRLLWKYREELDVRKLEARIKRMGLMKEWRAFGALAIDWVGMPSDAMPLYDKTGKYSRKAKKLLNWIIDTGNLGLNSDESYRREKPVLLQKLITFWKRIGGFRRRVYIFPANSIMFFISYVISRVKVTFQH